MPTEAQTKSHLAKVGFALLRAVALVTFTACTVGGSSNSQPTVKIPLQNEKPAGGILLVVGDSLAAGVGATDPSVTIGECMKRNFTKFNVIAHGIPGATSRDALQSLPKVIAKQARVVVISLGGNDVLSQMSGQAFGEQETFENLHFIYKELVKNGALVIQLGLNPPDARATRLPQIQTVADSEGVLFVPDILNGMWNNPAFMADRVHPNDAGYRRVCDYLVRTLSPQLQ